MPHTIETTLYTFEELSDAAKERAIEEIRERGWLTECFRADADLMLDWIKEEKAEPQGIDIRDVRWTDRGWANFDAAFEAWVDLETFMKAHKLAGKYRALFNVAREQNAEMTVDWAGCKIYEGAGDSFRQRAAEIRLYGWQLDEARDKLVNEQAAVVEGVLDGVLRGLRDEFASALNEELDYQNSDGYVTEYLEGSSYDFTEDGTLA